VKPAALKVAPISPTETVREEPVAAAVVLFISAVSISATVGVPAIAFIAFTAP
jgi:hypothetical protein